MNKVSMLERIRILEGDVDHLRRDNTRLRQENEEFRSNDGKKIMKEVISKFHLGEDAIQIFENSDKVYYKANYKSTMIKTTNNFVCRVVHLQRYLMVGKVFCNEAALAMQR